MNDNEIKSINDTKEKVLAGLFWTFGERILAQGVSFILSIILARILLPSEYGIIAMVMVFINIACYNSVCCTDYIWCYNLCRNLICIQG